MNNINNGFFNSIIPLNSSTSFTHNELLYCDRNWREIVITLVKEQIDFPQKAPQLHQFISFILDQYKEEIHVEALNDMVQSVKGNHERKELLVLTRELFEYIDIRDCRDPDLLLSLALVAYERKYDLFEIFKDFMSIPEEIIRKIAVLIIEQNVHILEKLKKKHHLDQKLVVEIAKYKAEKIEGDFFSDNISENIHHYAIREEKDRIEIAKIVAKRGGKIALFIKNYQIEDREALAEIAILSAHSKGLRFIDFIENYEIRDLVIKQKLFILALKNDRLWVKNCLELNTLPFSQLNTGWQAYKKERAPSLVFEQIERVVGPSLKSSIDELKELYLQFKEAYKKRAMEEALKTDKEIKSKLPLMVYIACLLEHYHSQILPEDEIILQKIFAWNDKQMQLELLDLAISSVFVNDSQRENYRHLSTNDNLCLFSLFLCKWNQDISSSARADLFQLAHKNRVFKDHSFQKALLDTARLLNQSVVLTNQERILLLTKALNANNKQSLKFYLFALQGLLETGHHKNVKELIEHPQLKIEQIYEQAIQESIPFSPIEHFSQKYAHSFEGQRNSSSLLIYAGRLKNLPFWEQTLALKNLATFIEDVLNQTYITNRYDEKKNPHLQFLFEGRGELKEKWMRNSQKSMKGEEDSPSYPHIDYAEFIRKKLLQENRLEQNKFPWIYKYLDAKEEEQQQVENEFIGTLKQVKQKGEYLETLRLQRALIGLTKCKDDAQATPLLLNIQNKLKAFPKNLSLTIDIGNLLKPLDSKHSLCNFTLFDTDNFWDAFINGSELKNCQRVDGDPKFNKCLLAYCLDGKNRFLIVKNREDFIVARAVIRLLWDEQKKEPVLVLERIYPEDSQFTSVIKQAALERAKGLNLDLYQDGNDDVFIESKGSRAPWEYSDLSGGIAERGIFKIKKAKKISLS